MQMPSKAGLSGRHTKKRKSALCHCHFHNRMHGLQHHIFHLVLNLQPNRLTFSLKTVDTIPFIRFKNGQTADRAAGMSAPTIRSERPNPIIWLNSRSFCSSFLFHQSQSRSRRSLMIETKLHQVMFSFYHRKPANQFYLKLM